MKKILVILLAVMTIMPQTLSAQSKALNKALKKQYTAKKKEFKKESWKLFGSSRTIDVCLLTHYEKLNELGEEGEEIVGYATVSSGRHKNLLKQNAMTNACNTYARNSGSHIKGRVASDMGLTDEEKSEFEHFYAAYEGLVDKEIRGELKESFTVIKEVSKNQVDMQVFYIVDIDAATKARIRAFENAAKESAVAQKYAEKVSDFIREGFENEMGQ